MNKIFLIIFWLSSALFTYWLGMEHGMNRVISLDEPTALMPEESIGKIQNADASPVLVAATKETKEKNVSLSKKQEVIKEDPREGKSLQQRMSSSNPVTRLQAFTEILQNPTDDNVATALELYENLPADPSRFSELRLLAFSWGQTDPQAALEWVESLDGFEQRLGSNSVLDAWAREDADSAIAWAKENFEGEDNPYFVGIIHGLAESNLFKATDLMTSLPYGRVRGRAASIVMGKYWEMGEGVALHLADNLPEGSVQNFAFGEIAERIAKEDLPRAVEWVDNMEESEIKVAASEDVAKRWARENPVSASEWVSAMPESESRSESMEEVVRVWAKQDPVATAEWLNQFPSGEFMDEPITAFVREVARKDPENALTWAQSIVDMERRNRVESEVRKIVNRANQKAEAKGKVSPSQDSGK